MTYNWKKINFDCYTTYLCINGKSITFEVDRRGCFRGVGVDFYKEDLKHSNPNLFISGKAENIDGAMAIIERYCDELLEKYSSSTKKEKELIVGNPQASEEKVEDTTTPQTDFITELESRQPEYTPITNDISVETEKTEEGETIITLISLSNSKIKYTTNGKEVETKSKIYKEPFNVKSGTTIKAMSFNENKEPISSISFSI